MLTQAPAPTMKITPGLVVREVSFSVIRGEAVCLLGRNGVGKSTLVKLACGFLRPTSGAVRLEGKEITGRPPSYNVDAGLTRELNRVGENTASVTYDMLVPA